MSAQVYEMGDGGGDSSPSEHEGGHQHEINETNRHETPSLMGSEGMLQKGDGKSNSEASPFEIHLDWNPPENLKIADLKVRAYSLCLNSSMPAKEYGLCLKVSEQGIDASFGMSSRLGTVGTTNDVFGIKNDFSLSIAVGTKLDSATPQSVECEGVGTVQLGKVEGEVNMDVNGDVTGVSVGWQIAGKPGVGATFATKCTAEISVRLYDFRSGGSSFTSDLSPGRSVSPEPERLP